MKSTILTADKNTLNWPSLPDKLAAIKYELNQGKNADWTVEIEYKSATPKINKEGRIDHTWLLDHIKPEYDQGSDMVPFHFSRRQRNAWGIKKSLRGSNPKTNAQVGDFWFWADEDTKRYGYNQFVEDFLHENAHEYHQKSGTPDKVHEWHEEHGTMAGYFKAHVDWDLYKSERQTQRKEIKRLQGILEAFKAMFVPKKPTTLLHPVEKYKNYISQAYGIANANFYPQTGHHIGTDYACPVGTPVLAPWDGEVIISGTSPALGNFCHYKYVFDGVTYVARLMHLSDVPAKAKYKRGELIELSGKTGKITGPHLHVDVWYNDVRLDLLTAKNWSLLTINPETHYVTNIH